MGSKSIYGYRLQRPGGLVLTKRAVGLCAFGSGSKIADIGCGTGESLEYLRNAFGFEVTGVDIDERSVSIAHQNGIKSVISGDSAKLPFETGSLDGILYECSFSKLDDPKKSLSEAYRVLKPDGVVIMTDFYARGEERLLNGVLGRMEHKGRIIERLASAGFYLKFFEDRTDDMRSLWGQMVFDMGLEQACLSIGAECRLMKEAEYGYGLFIAGKNKP